jgi:plasmid stabilization system protein ParE
VRLKWLRQARTDLFSIHDFIAAHNPHAAERVSQDISQAALRLKMFPQLGRTAHRSDVRLLQVPGRPYLIPYRIVDDTIEILAVFDQRREPSPEWT